MKIKTDNPEFKVSFGEIQMGAVFRYKNIVYVRLATPSEGIGGYAYNAMIMEDGRLAYFKGELVTPVDGYFVEIK